MTIATLLAAVAVAISIGIAVYNRVKGRAAENDFGAGAVEQLALDTSPTISEVIDAVSDVDPPG